MNNRTPTTHQDRLDQIVSHTRQQQEQREQSYRAQALKLYPWICGRCSREFSRNNLHELTVHHRDHNHDNNPSDGSNWELLCLYCHDNEHSRYIDNTTTNTRHDTKKQVTTHNPFAELKDIINKNNSSE